MPRSFISTTQGDAERDRGQRLGRIVLAAIAACFVFSADIALASDHDDHDEGVATRILIGQCYAACMDRAQTTALALYARSDRLSDLLISDEYHALTTDSQEQLVRLEEDAICALAQDHVRALDGCQASCQDIERSRGGNIGSAARTRFRHLFDAERRALQDVGLWRGYAESTTSGTAFDAGCDRYWGTGQSAASSLVASIPARVRHRQQRPLRVPPKPRTGQGGP